jgi:hypothetical protein
MAKKPRTPAPPRPVQAPKRRDTPRQRKPSTGGGFSTQDRRLWIGGGALAGIVAVAVVLWLVLGGGGAAAPKPVVWSSLSGLQTGPPPWGPNFATLPDRLAPLGLDQLGAEGQVVHIHQYLYLYVNGKRVTAPPNIGIYANEWITQLHVHLGEPNIVHVESPTKRNYSLGEFFGVWGVRLTQGCVGSFCGRLQWWVDGTKQSGDPGQLVLKEHQVITIALGKPPAVIPKTFDFGRYGL